ncbi:FAD-binding oxidoreductase [Aquirhabdus sp.]|uniref:FAD-binding oxidoreductase n=1 Tax=Aquirhabdus sp. TaxID=2824160 RepID=UPI00396CE8F7
MRRWNGWGDDAQDFPLKAKGLEFLGEKLGGKGAILLDASLADVTTKVPPSRLPAHPLVSQDVELRIRHARGESFPDWIAKHSGEFGYFPDGVALPETGEQVREVLTWAYDHGFIVIIYGGGTSVAGHINVPASDKPVLTLSLEKMDQLLDLNRESNVATFGAGTPGPRVESQLKEQGYVLGHFPQSWELSTVGGWVASRSSGQQSLRYGRIEQMFAGCTMETPRGQLVIKDIPASSAGPDLREVVMGSEGRIGAITEVKVRVTPLPEHESFHVGFVPDWESGLKMVRELAQGKVQLSLMRLSNADETESHLSLGGNHPLFKAYDRFLSFKKCRNGDRCMFTFGVTGSKRQARFALAEAKRAIDNAGGTYIASSFMGGIWEHSRFRSPYFRNGLWEHGYSVDTFETCINWDKVNACMNAMEQAIKDASDGQPVQVFSHLSHMYGQGCSIYTTYIFKNSDDYPELLARWQKYKQAAGDAIAHAGGTASHQHGIGRDHAPWLKVEKGAEGMALLHSIVTHFDPKQQLNPGCLLVDES